MDLMIKEDMFERGITRIGAEQEMCLIDSNWKPATVNMEAIAHINNPLFTTELAKFNLEANLPPLEFTGNAISAMHKTLKDVLERAIERVREMGYEILLVGILPTIRKFDVEIDNITPLERYYALMNALKELRNDMFELRINGIDELNLQQENAMLEACNTSFQVHLQVHPDEFVQKYNFAQAVAGPIMGVSVNSPLLFGRRLWKETRIALFQQSIDIRTFTQHLRDRSPRVTFGNSWLENSILDIYREDVARFKVILSTKIEEDVFEVLKKGEIPKLRALNIHNSTVYRWNRPCYGISDSGKPHLRIENRILPAGPSLPDEIANAAFWLGLMNGFADEYPDVRKVMEFDHAKANFFAAARLGMDAKFTWTHGKKVAAPKLLREQLLPIARNGLEKAGIDSSDIDTYLGIIHERVESGRTGSQWMLDSFTNLAKSGTTRDEISSALTASIFKNQQIARPVHEWELASMDDLDYEPSAMLVEEFMSTDLITVQEDDILDLVANLMDWKHIRHLPVEDRNGHLVGLITARMALRYFADKHLSRRKDTNVAVKSIMVRNPITVSPETSIIEAMEIMKKNHIGSLPVTKGSELVGIITETDFLAITRNLINRFAMRKTTGS
jgi:CBS domain-containing protein/gamma-glutamyl:cysteine ligase YbdK (ATP-grasp superfamily)